MQFATPGHITEHFYYNQTGANYMKKYQSGIIALGFSHLLVGFPNGTPNGILSVVFVN